MKASDVVIQLQNKLPGLTDDFTTDFSVTSLTRSGSTVTVVTSAPHGLSSGQFVNINGARELNPLVLTFLDGVVSAVTTNNHDLTVPSLKQINNDNVQPFNRATVSETVETEYNGTFTIATAVNRRNFTYLISGTPSTPATGTPVLEQDFGYNGRFSVTVLDTTSFTYTITTTPVSPAGGTIIVGTQARVSASFSIAMFIRAYTEQGLTERWICVVSGDIVTLGNRAILTDAAQENSKQDAYRIRLIEPFKIYVVSPAVASLSGRDIRDDMEDTREQIYRSILGVIFPTSLECDTWSQTTALGDRYASESSTDAVYVHEFRFERVVDITFADTKGPSANRAFRDFDQDNTFDSGTGDLDADINLDKQPL